ncbi:unnamed protein product [Urochloa decumbens]|uniref:RING-type domain-containing protein n=1 Tax=Urochloa decumbens TaxID=240449 RepID=A0ABC9HC86_9POAL
MQEGARRALAKATTRAAARARERTRARAEGAAEAPGVTCGICGGLLPDATTVVSECLHAFCSKCIYDKVEKEGIKGCPTCGAHFDLGSAPKEKLRSDQHDKRKVVAAENKKRKEMVSTEPALSSAVDIIIGPLPHVASQIETQEIEVEVIGEADEDLNLAPVARNALTVQQPQPILEEMVPLDQLAPRQDPETFGPLETSDTKHQRQVPTLQMTNTSVMAGSSLHARMTVQEEKLRGDVLSMFKESNETIMGRYDAYISQLKADCFKLTKELENEKTASGERIRICEEGFQRALQNDRDAAVVRIRTLNEELHVALSRSGSLEEENARLTKKLKSEAASREGLMSYIVSISVEHATLAQLSDILVSDKTGLENKVEHLTKELENAKKKQAESIHQILADVAKSASRELEGNPYG